MNFKISKFYLFSISVAFTLTLTLVFNFGCVEVKHKDKNQSTDSTTPPTNTSDNLKNINTNKDAFRFHSLLEDSGHAYHYRLKIEWQTPEGLTYPLHAYLNNEEVTTTPITSPLLLNIPAGQENLVELKIETEKNGWINLWNQTVQTPKDLYVFDQMTLNKKTQFKVQRIFFGDKGKIITMGNPLSIEANRLYSKGGSIETFPDGATAIANVNGRSGGTIDVLIEQGFGELTVNLRGESGGIGSNGPNWQTAQPDSPAGDGGAGICMELNPFSEKHCICPLPPKNGVDGAKGNKGLIGGPGSAGGNTGQINIEVKKPTDKFLVTMLKFPGLGGLGGPGGPGQKGGKPGEPGPRGHSSCPKASPGKFLGDGEQGDTGPSGPIGDSLPSCQTLGTEKTCN